MPISTDNGQPTSTQSVPSFPALESFRLKGLPPAAYYIPDFITREEEEYLLKKIQESPQPKWKTVGSGRRLQYWGGNMSGKGVLLPEPMPEFLTAFPNIIERIESFLDIAAGVPEEEMRQRDRTLDINQVLVNEYQPLHGISDGPAFRPLVVTISLGSHTVLDIHHYLSATSSSPPMTASPDTDTNQGRPIAAIPLGHILLLPRSLLILSSSLYASHLHGITAQAEDVVHSASSSDERGTIVANENVLNDSAVTGAIQQKGGWRKARGARTSLTFRHADKVLKGGAFSLMAGGLRRG